MNTINLGKYQIRQGDSLNIILEKIGKNSKTGEPTNVVLGYYGNIPSALKGYVKFCMADDKKWQNYDEVIKAYQELQKTIEKVGKQIDNIR